MKPCPHKHVEARIWSRRGQCWIRLGNRDGRSVDYDALICRDCGEWLGVGHSDETPVAVEVRAAEIAAAGYFQARTSDGEDAGWTTHVLDRTHGYENEPGHDAGYLARAIATHSEPQ